MNNKKKHNILVNILLKTVKATMFCAGAYILLAVLSNVGNSKNQKTKSKFSNYSKQKNRSKKDRIFL